MPILFACFASGHLQPPPGGHPAIAAQYAKISAASMSLGTYIQVPFCQTRCSYCNFHTGVVSSSRFAPYALAVQTEIREHEKRLAQAGVLVPGGFSQLTVDTVYFGGGTPSLLDPAHLQSVLTAIRETFR